MITIVKVKGKVSVEVSINLMIHSFSYRVQVHSKIAKVILTSKPDCRITRNCVLPQITGSSETILTGLKKSRHYSPKALKKFMKMDTRILEVESRCLYACIN